MGIDGEVSSCSILCWEVLERNGFDQMFIDLSGKIRFGVDLFQFEFE